MAKTVFENNIYQIISDAYIGCKRLNNLVHFWVSEEEVDDFFSTKNIFFILSIGRSGTKFLSHLLDKSPSAYVVHEPLYLETRAHANAFYSEKKAREYIKNFRKKEMYLRARDKNIETYGEVNSLLRRHTNALKELIPSATFLHLIRDGRDVVRSMYSRETMKPWATDTRWLHPKKGDPLKDQWKNLSRFEKLCWYWRTENVYLRENLEHTIHFEKILSSYKYFSGDVLGRIDVEITKDIWEQSVTKPKNVTKRNEYALPPYPEWDSELKNAFEDICGDEMLRNNYAI